MTIEIRHSCEDFKSYRAARVKSLFNATTGYNWSKDVELPIEGKDWQIGLIVGASGSGKTSVGRVLAEQLGSGEIYDLYAGWHNDRPIIDDISPNGDFNVVTSALSSVGLGDVPAWLRPFNVLSNGEKFRAGLARLVVERPDVVVVDEFTSVIDRQIAKVGAAALQKSWRRGPGKIILLSCHYDIIEWLQPDWGYDMNEARFFERDCLQPRPPLKLEIYKVHGTVFPRLFKKHYYLDLPMPIAGEYFVGAIDGESVCHLAVCPQFQAKHYRATRLVTMPEWQGIGVATKFLAEVCQMHLEGLGRCGKKYTTIFHTSHPQLCMALRHSKKWVQKSAVLYGTDKGKSGKTILKAAIRENHGIKIHGGGGTEDTSVRSRGSSTLGRYGVHFRAVQGFEYIGERK